MTLEEYREELDVIDKTLEEYFIKRMEIVTRIGDFKRANGIPTLDSGREAAVLKKHTEHIPEAFRPYMEEYFKAMMALSRQYQDAAREK